MIIKATFTARQKYFGALSCTLVIVLFLIICNPVLPNQPIKSILKTCNCAYFR